MRKGPADAPGGAYLVGASEQIQAVIDRVLKAAGPMC
jgi:hypothetical protein